MKAFYIILPCAGIICCHAEMPEVIPLRSRNVFYRMEPDAWVEFDLVNQTSSKTEPARLEVAIAGRASSADVPSLAPETSKRVRCPLDLSARPGDYKLNVSIGSPAAPARKLFDYKIKILPRKPVFMPVVMWSNRGKNIADYGFTHFLKFAIFPV